MAYPARAINPRHLWQACTDSSVFQYPPSTYRSIIHLHHHKHNTMVGRDYLDEIQIFAFDPRNCRIRIEMIYLPMIEENIMLECRPSSGMERLANLKVEI